MTGAALLADEAATLALGAALARAMRVGDVIALSGPLGAGKTTLVRGLLRSLGAGEVPSPSFPIVVDYAPPEVRVPVWHVDLYRIADPAEADELGLDDALGHAALLVEWPERLGWQERPDALALRLEADGEDARRLTWRAGAAWSGRWPPSPA